MKAIKFKEQTTIIALDQPQYVPLPIHIGKTPEVEMTACFKLTPEEIKEINETGCIWNTQLTFGDCYHPVRLSTRNPFI